MAAAFASSTGRPVEETAVDHRPGAGPRPTFESFRRLDGSDDGQLVCLGEPEVALVLAGDRHHRSGAVGGDDVVGDVDRDRLAGERIDAAAAGESTALVCRSFGHPADVGLSQRDAAEFGDGGFALGRR